MLTPRNQKSGNDAMDDDEAGGGGWQIVFSGFVLILLCFFIMLSSFATMERAKVLQFVASFSSSLSILPGGNKLTAGERVVRDSSDIVDVRSELAAIQAELEEWVAANDLAEGLELFMVPEGLMLRFPDSLVFDVGSAELTEKARAILDAVSEKILRCGLSMRIEGHTDNVPIHTRRFPTNWELSTGRAINVLRFFAEKHRVPAERLTAMGFGEYRPVVSNDTPDQRAKNRRVDIILVDPGAAAASPPRREQSDGDGTDPAGG